MAKKRQKHASDKKKKDQGAMEVDSLDEGDWMVVKQQIVTILIPPLPNKTQYQNQNPNVKEGQIQENPEKAKSQTQCSLDISPLKQSVHETEKPISLSPRIMHPPEPNLTSQKPSSLSNRIASDNFPVHRSRDGNGNVNEISICRTSKSRKGLMVFADSNPFINRMMRASYLEKKLQKAGGLENWLTSVGLSRFMKVFHKKRVDKFQLANLTMKKLKDMGTYAVGPRRKLLHAIDCLCEPHCFQLL